MILPPRYIYADNLTFLDHSISLQASADSSDVEEIVKEHPESEEIVFKEEKVIIIISLLKLRISQFQTPAVDSDVFTLCFKGQNQRKKPKISY